MRRLMRAAVRCGAGALLFVGRAALAQAPAPAPEKLALGDWSFTPSMEVRVRGEYRGDAPDLGGTSFLGQPSGRVRNAWVVMERSRLGLGAERGPVRAQITLQDARAAASSLATGAVRSDASRWARFEPYEAFLEAHGAGARPSYVRVGRQAIVWGEGRLLGNADFAPSGRSLDAARVHVGRGALDVEALAALLELPGPLGSSFGDRSGPTATGVQLYGLTAGYAFAPLLRAELFGFARIARSDGSEVDGSRFSLARLSSEKYTGSLRLSGAGRGYSWGAEGAYQGGHVSSLAGDASTLAAWAAYAHVEKTLDAVFFTPTVRVEGSYASGDDGRGKYKQFDPLYADPQRFHGAMDLFAWSNLADVGGSVRVEPARDTALTVGYRYARLAAAQGEWIGGYLTAVGSAIRPPATGVPAVSTNVTDAKDLGHELDVSLAWRALAGLEVRAGWSGLLLGMGAKDVLVAHDRGSHDAGAVVPASLSQYAYLQGTVTLP